MKKKTSHQQPNTLSRRKFLKMGIGAAGMLAALEVGGAGLLFLQPRDMEGKPSGIVPAGLVDDFPPGSVTEFTDGRFFLVRSHDGGFLAVYRRCPHLGCIVNWQPDEESFYCPCHASSFDMYGNFDSAPVSRALDTFAIRIKDDAILVDTSHLQQREGFDPAQLSYA